MHNPFLTTIEYFINQKPDLKTGKAYLLKYLEKKYPEYNLQDLRAINFHFAQDDFEKWLLEITDGNSIPANIKSLWFGLSVWNYGGLKEITQIGMIGSQYNPIEQEEWACYRDYVPNDPIRYLQIFEDISISINQYKQWSDFEEYNELESIVFLCVTCLLLTQTLPNISDLLLINQKSLYVGFGYNSGDRWDMGRLTLDGWRVT